MEPIERDLTEDEIEALKRVEEYFISKNYRMTKKEKLNYALSIAQNIMEGRDAIHEKNFINLPHSLIEITRIIEKIIIIGKETKKEIKVLVLTMPNTTNNNSK